MTNEPITLTEGIRLLVVATIALLTAFNAWNPTPEQLGAVLGVYGAASVVLSLVARQKSTPTNQVALTTDQADALQGN